MRLSAIRLIQGVRELTVRASNLAENYSLLLPGSKPTTGSIPRFKDNEGGLEWFNLSIVLQDLTNRITVLAQNQGNSEALASNLNSLGITVGNLSSSVAAIRQANLDQDQTLSSLTQSLDKAKSDLLALEDEVEAQGIDFFRVQHIYTVRARFTSVPTVSELQALGIQALTTDQVNSTFLFQGNSGSNVVFVEGSGFWYLKTANNVLSVDRPILEISLRSGDLIYVDATEANKGTYYQVDRSNPLVTSLLVDVKTPSHKFVDPTEYLFNDFYGGSTVPFIEGSSGTGQSSQFLTGTPTGYYRLNGGTAVNARRAVRTSLDNVRLGREPSKYDLFRSRFYISNQATNDYSVIRLGFMNNETATPTLGVFLEGNIAASPNWRIIIVGGTSNQTIDTGIPINTANSDNREFRFSIKDSKANFYLDNFTVEGLSGIPTNGGFFGTTIIKTLGVTNNSVSIDHLGCGVRQTL